jgi:GH25 family lysozyme M1 (1,4-beta-N-acetylmuramidase)
MKYVALIAFAFASYCTYGVDYSTLFKISQIECLTQANIYFVIPRAFCSTGELDPNIKQNLKNAWAGGMTHVDVYMFPCFPCNNPEEQVKTLISELKGYKYGIVWVDIERRKWSKNLEKNRKFLLALIAELGKKAYVGIYTNYNNWVSIVGADWEALKHFPLWYAHYDNDDSFSDFEPFGGWREPSMKQYKGTTKMCNGEVDFDLF